MRCPSGVSDLHDYGGLNGRLVDVEEARAAVAGRG
jgi:hypothetical protein